MQTKLNSLLFIFPWYFPLWNIADNDKNYGDWPNKVLFDKVKVGQKRMHRQIFSSSQITFYIFIHKRLYKIVLYDQLITIISDSLEILFGDI